LYRVVLFLVVPGNNYKTSAPVVVGTNVVSTYINQLQDLYGNIYLQSDNMFILVLGC